MKYIKRFNVSNNLINESFKCDDIEVVELLTKIKDDCADISDKFDIEYNWETYPSLEEYIRLLKDDGFTKDNLSFYITIFKGKEFKRNSENWNHRTIVMEDPDKAIDKKLELLEYEIDFFKRIKHLIKISDLYLWGEELDYKGSVTLVADFKRS